VTAHSLKEEKNNAESVNTTSMHGSGKDVFWCSAPPNGCRDTQHPISRIKQEKLFSGDQVAEACAPPGVLLRCF
jgi:hypothetical protein